MQQSGGLLPAAAGRSGTSIFASGENAYESPRVHQRITVILIQRNDGYFIPKIDVLVTFKRNNVKASVIADLKSLNHSQSLNYSLLFDIISPLRRFLNGIQ